MTRRASCLTLLSALLAIAAPPVAAADLRDFARCLTRAGVTYYTASWCPHCARQSRLFGGALRYLHVVDCTNGCAGVVSFPTWGFANGSRISGFAPLELLAGRTGCPLDHERREEGQDDDVTPSSSGSGRRHVGGVMIIEVPRR